MNKEISEIQNVPIYGMVEAAHYIRVPYQTLRYWIRGRDPVRPLVKLTSENPPRLSFLNLLECHMLSAFRGFYDLRLPKVRRALATAERMFALEHPLLDLDLHTNRVDIFVRNLPNELVNLSRGGQLGMEAVLQTHLQRIERDPAGLFSFFPFVEERSLLEPKHIVLNPTVAFGRPVISGTGISTSFISSRFHARDSVSELAAEYDLPQQKIEEAIRWESNLLAA